MVVDVQDLLPKRIFSADQVDRKHCRVLSQLQALVACKEYHNKVIRHSLAFEIKWIQATRLHWAASAVTQPRQSSGH
jgi:hypothetical protein